MNAEQIVARSMLLVELALTVARNTRAEPDEQGRGFLRALMAHEAISYGSIWLTPQVAGALAEDTEEVENSASFPSSYRDVDRQSQHSVQLFSRADHTYEVSNLTHGEWQSVSERIRCEGLVRIGRRGVLRLLSTSERPELEQMVKSILPVVEIASSSIEGARARVAARVQEERAIQAYKLVAAGEFATKMAHELNQPLNAMRLGVNNLLHQLHQPDDAEPLPYDALRAKLLRVDTLIGRVGEITGNILRFGRSHSAHTRVNVKQLIETVTDSLAEEFRFERVVLDRDLPAQTMHIAGEWINCEQILRNILNNCREQLATLSGDSDRYISIKADRSGQSHLVIVVEDTGGGISKEVLAEAGLRAISTKAPSEHRGLGLAVCTALINEMRGKLWLSNTSRGLKVTLRLPLYCDDEPVDSSIAKPNQRKIG